MTLSITHSHAENNKKNNNIKIDRVPHDSAVQGYLCSSEAAVINVPSRTILNPLLPKSMLVSSGDGEIEGDIRGE